MPPRADRNNYLIPKAISTDVKETQWGWHNDTLARLLCPMALVGEFDRDPGCVYPFTVLYASSDDQDSK